MLKVYKCINVCKSYGNKKILQNISCEFKDGELTGLAGANGAGKSTFLSILNGNLKPTSGILEFDNTELSKLRNLPFSYIPQDTCLFEELSIKDNIKFWECAFNSNCNQNFFTKDELKQKVASLSGGQKKLLSIMIGLIGEPKFLIFDEPTSSLDILYRNKIMDIICNLRDEGKSVIISSHYIDELFMCDRIIVLSDKEIKINDNPKNLGNKEEIEKKIINLIDGGKNGRKQH